MATGQEIKEKFDTQWGSFRKWIAANPLSGFWTGVGVGAALLAGLRLISAFFGVIL